MSLRESSYGLVFVLLACNPGQADLPSESPGSVVGNTPFPCDVGRALQSKCWGCHGIPTNYGAPMSLTSTEAVHEATRDGSEALYQRMKERIHSASAPMPPMPFPRLTPAETAVLDTWIDAGAPPGNGCMPPPPQPGAGGAPAANGGAPPTSGAGGAYYGNGGMPSYGGDGSGGSPFTGPPPLPDAGCPQWSQEDVPREATPDECDYMTFHARRDPGGAKYGVPAGEQYYCFGFHVPLEQGAQGLAFYPEIDNTQVIHHWLLYKAKTPQIDGAINVCLGFHPDGELLAGWAPGAGPMFLPEHVGLELGGGDFILEVHYNNTGAATEDASGVRVCKAKEHRPNTASVSWLGTEAIIIPPAAKAFQVPSNCRPSVTTPIHILKSWPHMHKLGRHMTTLIHRANGEVEPLVDVNFDFNYQWGYDTPTILNQGDWIQTTCFFDNDTGGFVTFGESTGNEMCYDFTIAYPAHALVTGGLMSTACNN